LICPVNALGVENNVIIVDLRYVAALRYPAPVFANELALKRHNFRGLRKSEVWYHFPHRAISSAKPKRPFCY